MKGFEQLPSPEVSKSPKQLERSRLERFGSPAAKWLGMAAIALSSEACAAFRGSSGESGLIKAVSVATFEPSAAGFDYQVTTGQANAGMNIKATLSRPRTYPAQTESEEVAQEVDPAAVPENGWFEVRNGKEVPFYPKPGKRNVSSKP